jgi:perosamine synthetase
MIPVNKPKYYPESYENIKRVLDSAWTGLGPETAKFEQEFADYIGAKYAIALNSGTEALRLALEAANPPKDTYAITTPNTFVSTNHVLLQYGLKPLFADIDPNTGSLNFDSVVRLAEKYDGEGISLLMVVHYGGMPIDIDAFQHVADHFGLVLIEDCAHACGAVYKDRLVGSMGMYNCFSFHAVKNLSAGDGGAITTDSADVFKTIRKLRWLGIDKDTSERTTSNYYRWDYDCPTLGYKSHMNDITAAIARGQLLHLDQDNAYREMLVERYYEHLLFNPHVEIVNKKRSDRRSSNHLFVIRIDTFDSKRRIREALQKAEIGYGMHYKPNFFYEPYENCIIESKNGMLEFFRSAITLPLHPHLKISDIDTICDIIQKATK